MGRGKPWVLPPRNFLVHSSMNAENRGKYSSLIGTSKTTGNKKSRRTVLDTRIPAKSSKASCIYVGLYCAVVLVIVLSWALEG